MSELVENIQIEERRCGKRIPGGLYFVGDIPVEDMSNFLPRRLKCSCGIPFLDFSRNVQKIQPYVYFPELRKGEDRPANMPALFDKKDNAWIVSVGQAKGYATPGVFIEEAQRLGISRYIKEIPRGFKIGESWVFLLHAKVFSVDVPGQKKPDWEPGIFAMFKPRRIEYVVKGGESEVYLKSLIERGITPVNPSYI